MQHPTRNGRARSIELAAPAKCRLCGKTLIGPVEALGGVLQAGVPVSPRFLHFMETLFRHVAEEHKQHWAKVERRLTVILALDARGARARQASPAVIDSAPCQEARA